MSNPTVTAILQNLKKNGWLKHQPDPTDSRSKLPILTEQSLAKEQEFNQLFRDMKGDLLVPLTLQERHSLMVLRITLNNLFLVQTVNLLYGFYCYYQNSVSLNRVF
ncbi:hypothetical protein STRCR_2242 [Streptococcus criceti HS-6]|uniref:HTH marR-type domain-containing protein n=1 Tax=Streptococcus criceti HS-6 TaxID=873449 RepID=G5JSX1_STRCG|nr:hypothetical protein STRCR_2242 [Streptococcus criceti HS-6]